MVTYGHLWKQIEAAKPANETTGVVFDAATGVVFDAATGVVFDAATGVVFDAAISILIRNKT
jgi:hypothetical protein